MPLNPDLPSSAKTSAEEILSLLPHRPPFLWIDRVVKTEKDRIIAEKDIPVDLDIFQGHFPGHPILPGVLLCEAAFQAGALLIASIGQSTEKPQGLPMVTRILGAKFKRQVKPGDTISLHVRLKEQVGPAWFMRGKILVSGKTAATVDFACVIQKTETD